jgi:hypothetical protein
MLVTLSPQEFIAASVRAAIIRGVKEVTKVNNRRVMDMPDFDVHLIGLLGEFAVMKATGIPIREDITFAGDGMVDMTCRGVTIQIKTRRQTHKTTFHYVNSMDEFQAQLMISCTLETLSRVRIHGFITRARFERYCETIDMGYGKRLSVSDEVLTPIDKLDKAIECLTQPDAIWRE